MARDLEGKVAVVTGAGRGIGRAFALALAAAGCRVVAADVDTAGAEQTVGLIRDAHAAMPALAQHVDVTQRSSVDQLMAEAMREWSGLDILVNDAGVFPRSTVLEMDERMWDHVLGVNLKGTFLCAQAAARILVGQGRGGRIVNMVSRAAYTPYARGAHYAASKAGILGFTRSLAAELGAHRITVNAIAPGTVNTAMPRAAGVSDEQLFASGHAYPLGRIAEPDDMAPALLFLCGESGAYTTGQVLHVNGGSFMP
jgi:NAD(P)-dependent dehydrogenase (short-subunit alcohol dehydrogenase family)